MKTTSQQSLFDFGQLTPTASKSKKSKSALHDPILAMMPDDNVPHTLDNLPTAEFTPPFADQALTNYQIGNYTIDWFYPEQRVAVCYYPLDKHIKISQEYGKNYLHDMYQFLKSQSIRLISIYWHFASDPRMLLVAMNCITHALGKTPKRHYARNLKLVIRPAIELKQFYNDNNINGYRNAKTAFTLVDPQTNETIMAYSVGHAYFGKGLYHAEIARGACRIGHSVVGGASKLWKAIIDYYKDKDLENNPGSVDSIVYYVELNLYNGQSLGFLENTKFICETASFWNYWLDECCVKNREPMRHAEIMSKIRQGKIFTLHNVGNQTNVWERYPVKNA